MNSTLSDRVGDDIIITVRYMTGPPEAQVGLNVSADTFVMQWRRLNVPVPSVVPSVDMTSAATGYVRFVVPRVISATLAAGVYTWAVGWTRVGKLVTVPTGSINLDLDVLVGI